LLLALGAKHISLVNASSFGESGLVIRWSRQGRRRAEPDNPRAAVENGTDGVAAGRRREGLEWMLEVEADREEESCTPSPSPSFIYSLSTLDLISSHSSALIDLSAMVSNLSSFKS
jgi:hypothetical protein